MPKVGSRAVRMFEMMQCIVHLCPQIRVVALHYDLDVICIAAESRPRTDLEALTPQTTASTISHHHVKRKMIR